MAGSQRQKMKYSSRYIDLYMQRHRSLRLVSEHPVWNHGHCSSLSSEGQHTMEFLNSQAAKDTFDAMCDDVNAWSMLVGCIYVLYTFRQQTMQQSNCCYKNTLTSCTRSCPVALGARSFGCQRLWLRVLARIILLVHFFHVSPSSFVCYF